MHEVSSSTPPYKVFTFSELIALNISEPRYLLEPVIPEKGLVLLFAKTGIGKTFAAISMSIAIATGTEAFGWKAPTPQQVLYVDGEMAAYDLVERTKLLSRNLGEENDNLRFFVADLQDRPMVNLATKSGQDEVERFITPETKFIVIDNLATLCHAGKENEAESWSPVQRWLLDLRRRGVTVMVVHHAGKSGSQRGTSAKEDVMNSILCLCRPDDYAESEGARFLVKLTKGRKIKGHDANPFEVVLVENDDGLIWERIEIEDRKSKVKRLKKEGKTLEEIKKETGVATSTASRWLKE